MNYDDVEAVTKLEQECFSRPWSKESLKKEVNNPNSLFLIYEINKKTIGYIGMYLVIDEADITNIVITKSYRGKGYGKKLLAEAINQVFSMGYLGVTLEVRKSNKTALSLYERLGFKIEGERRNFYDTPLENALIMWKRKSILA